MKNHSSFLESPRCLICLLAILAPIFYSCSQPASGPEETTVMKEMKGRETAPVIALYGFSREDPRFKDKSAEDIRDILKSWGINAVFGAHTDQELSPVLRRGGIKLYAEFGVFAGESLWEQFPGSRPLTSEGQPLGKLEWYAGVNPSNEEVRKERLQSFRIILETYPLDGIWLDFIRWPGRWEKTDPQLIATSFDKATLEKFGRETGIIIVQETSAVEAARLILDKYPEEWASWRCDQITGWVEEARQIIDLDFSGTQLGLFGVPWTDDFNNAIVNYMGQDYEALGKFIDLFSPMVYHKMCGRPVTWIEKVTIWVGKTTGRDVLPIIQSVDEPVVLSADEFGESVRAAVNSPGSRGVIVFNLKGLNEEKLKTVGEALDQ